MKKLIDKLAIVNPKTISLFLFIFMHVSCIYAEKILQTEMNGFKWYLNIRKPYSTNYYDAYSIDDKPLIIGNVNDEVLYLCISKNDPGRFIHIKYKNGGGYTYNLYDSHGNFIADIFSSKHFIGKEDFKRIAADGSYFTIIKDFNHHDYYGVIDDNGKITIPFGQDPISDKVHDLNGTLKDCLRIGECYENSGLIKPNGEYIIPQSYKNKIYGDGNFIKFYTSNGVSLLDNEGNFLIRDAEHIEIKQGEASVITNGNRGIYSVTDYKWIISPESGYDWLQRFNGPNKMNYYKVRDTGTKTYGIINIDGSEVLPCEFEDIEYIGGDLFKFKSGSNWGVVNINSKVIIPTSRGYSSIGKYSSIQKTIPFTKPGYKGECNHLGRQISLHKDISQTGSQSTSKSSGSSTTAKSIPTNTASSGSVIKSENNDKYWYDKYTEAQFTANEDDLDKSTFKNTYAPSGGSFEIQFEHTTTGFVTIYLNQITSSEKCTRLQTLGKFNIHDSKSVTAQQDNIKFRSPTTQVVINEAGEIIIYYLSNGKYRSAMFFKPNNVQSAIYKIRYEELRKKIK